MDLSFLQSKNLDGLARRMKTGDESAAHELYSIMLPKVYGFCMSRVGSIPEAEDLTQEIFIKLVNRVELYDERRGHFVGWFWQLARNTLIDYYRGKKKTETAFSDLEDGAEENFAEAANEERVDTKKDYEHVLRFVKTLSNEERELFELRFIADLSYKEIAGMTNRSEGSLRVAINRIRQKIKTQES